MTEAIALVGGLTVIFIIAVTAGYQMAKPGKEQRMLLDVNVRYTREDEDSKHASPPSVGGGET